MITEFFIPIKTVSEANKREHWSVASARHKEQKQIIRVELWAHKVPKTLPCRVHMTRTSPRMLDDDNLQSALKYIRDAVSEYLIPGTRPGMADNDPQIKWSYAQAKQKEQGIYLTFIQ